MTVKFTKAGTYTYYCDLHPGMKASVTVAKKGATVPTAKQDAAAVKKQADAASRPPRTSQDQPGREHRRPRRRGQGRRRVLRHGPVHLTVAPGTTVKFQMTKGSYEAHTATFGPGDIERPVVLPRGIAASFESPAIDPRASTRATPPSRRSRSARRRTATASGTRGVLDAAARRRCCPSPRRQVRHAPAPTSTTA